MDRQDCSMFQFPENAIFEEASELGAATKIVFVLSYIVYISVDQSKLKSRFPGVPQIYPANAIPTFLYGVTAEVIRMFKRSITAG